MDNLIAKEEKTLKDNWLMLRISLIDHVKNEDVFRRNWNYKGTTNQKERAEVSWTHKERKLREFNNYKIYNERRLREFNKYKTHHEKKLREFNTYKTLKESRDNLTITKHIKDKGNCK